jgi:hypothetical protein
MQLRTSYDGAEIPHRELWLLVQEQAGLAGQRERDWFRPTLVAMVFAFHTVEAYVNYLGEKLAPEIWADERNFFRNEPYRGWEGKLGRTMELVNIEWSPSAEPLSTVLELRRLRDLIAHGKAERLRGEILHHDLNDNLHPISTVRGMVTPKDRLGAVLPQVEGFIQSLHTRAYTRNISPRRMPVSSAATIGSFICASATASSAASSPGSSRRSHPTSRSMSSDTRLRLRGTAEKNFQSRAQFSIWRNFDSRLSSCFNRRSPRSARSNFIFERPSGLLMSSMRAAW